MKAFVSPVQALMSCPDPFLFLQTRNFVSFKQHKTYPEAKYFLYSLELLCSSGVFWQGGHESFTAWKPLGGGWPLRNGQKPTRNTTCSVLRLQVFLWRCCEIPGLDLHGLDCTPVLPELQFLRENQHLVCYLRGHCSALQDTAQQQGWWNHELLFINWVIPHVESLDVYKTAWVGWSNERGLSFGLIPVNWWG